MCIVLFKKLKYESFLAKNECIHETEYGVPTQYGLFFAMGLTLFMEGVISSSYHVCPTNVTFQFDTTFMYLIAVLMFMKLYQVRHSDVSANAVGVFFGLGVVKYDYKSLFVVCKILFSELKRALCPQGRIWKAVS